MKFLNGISKKSKISLFVALGIMIMFFILQSCVAFKICKCSYELTLFGYISIIAFFIVVYEFLTLKNIVLNQLNENVKELTTKNTYLEHAAKILRHDMHSGINTYMPRGLSSLSRRVSDEKAKELKIDAPLKMISEGLRHTQKVYKGVYEFTNLVKKDAVLNREECNLNTILEDYLSSTAYRPQVILEDLGTFSVNEPLFCTAVDNLIRNGLKYNDSNNKLVKIHRQNDFLYIEDNGRGMTNEEFIYLSQPYTRKEDQQESGTGLGLNICIAILKEHNFTIECKKLEEGGTQLKISLAK
jgi:K+-sensing histidine kinase KdpD